MYTIYEIIPPPLQVNSDLIITIIVIDIIIIDIVIINNINTTTTNSKHNIIIVIIIREAPQGRSVDRQMYPGSNILQNVANRTNKHEVYHLGRHEVGPLTKR